MRTNRPGIALLVVVMLTMVVAAIAAGAALIGANSFLINEYDQKQSLLASVADAGLELGRARMNGDPALFPADTGYATLEYEVDVRDAGGTVIPGVKRSLYAGPVGGGPGEYGSFGTIISIAQEADGARVIRRMDLTQSSFAVYAYFTDYEADNIMFGGNDQLYGPVHSNSNVKVRSTGATFHGDVTTAGVFEGTEYAVFQADTTSGVMPILMPTTNDLTRLQPRASPAHLAFTGSTLGGEAQSGMRIEFVSRDIDGDGVAEGFIKVYRASDAGWVSGDVPTSSDGMLVAENCGHFVDGVFKTYKNKSQQLTALRSASRRCYLGGTDSIWGGTFTASDSKGGQWQPYPGTVHPDVAATQPDAGYLFPIDRRLNPAFRGVIYVDGKVVVSGTVRGRVTLAATGNIVIADDIVYHTDPGAGTCTDMLGLFSGAKVMIADNMLNSPNQPATGEAFYTFDDTRDEHIHAVLLALDEIAVENWWTGSTSHEPCNTTTWGRGCLYVTGGLIQRARGAVGSSLGHGYVKRYSYDTCAVDYPPPYFPTTGHFSRSRFYEIDPTGFDVRAYFQAIN